LGSCVIEIKRLKIQIKRFQFHRRILTNSYFSGTARSKCALEPSLPPSLRYFPAFPFSLHHAYPTFNPTPQVHVQRRDGPHQTGQARGLQRVAAPVGEQGSGGPFWYVCDVMLRGGKEKEAYSFNSRGTFSSYTFPSFRHTRRPEHYPPDR